LYFSGDVLAYYSCNCGEEIFSLILRKVSLPKLRLQQASEFKYSEFAQATSFSGSAFNDVAISSMPNLQTALLLKK